MTKAIRTACGLLTLTLGATVAVGVACADAGPEVITTESGLEYQMLREGEGPTPTLADRVIIHYRGMLTDSTEFDSSHDRGEPANFEVNGVIAGFGEALQLMSVGSQIRVTIPAELGYGEAGFTTLIGPNETLIFEIELLEIIKG